MFSTLTGHSPVYSTYWGQIKAVHFPAPQPCSSLLSSHPPPLYLLSGRLPRPAFRSRRSPCDSTNPPSAQSASVVAGPRRDRCGCRSIAVQPCCHSSRDSQTGPKMGCGLHGPPRSPDAESRPRGHTTRIQEAIIVLYGGFRRNTS